MNATAFGTKRSLAAYQPTAGRIGPNAVLQLEAALREGLGQAALESVFRRAGLSGLLADPPRSMIDERIAVALYGALFAELPKHAPAIAADAGRRTADYVRARRIPALARLVVSALPAWLAAGLLLQAIAKNGWTFAGSGRVRVEPGHRHLIEIVDNPLVMPRCIWHTAVFQRLFETLVSADSRVRCVQSEPPSRFIVSVYA